MEIETNSVPEMTIEKFADLHGLVMTVTERDSEDIKFCKRYHGGTEWRYFANFRNCEVAENGMLAGHSGDGNTPEDAIGNYARRISEKPLVLNSYTSKRKELNAPRFITGEE